MKLHVKSVECAGILLALVAANAKEGSCEAVRAGDLAERVAADVAKPVRPGGVAGQSFWNGNAVWFMYPPSFDFPEYPGCRGYRFQVRGADGVWHSFLSETPRAVLTNVWNRLPSGHTEVRCTAWEAHLHQLQMTTRTFWKMKPFDPASFPRPARSYADAAKAGLGYMLDLPHMRTFVATGTPDASYRLNCYPSKIHGATIRAMVLYAKLSPERREEALKLARTAADYLISSAQPAGSPLAYFPPTYEGSAYMAGKYAGMNMLVYPADAGLGYLELYQVTGEKKYLQAAVDLAATYLRLQGADGSWYLKMYEKDGTPVNPNRLHPVGVLDLMDALHAETKDPRYRDCADRAFAYFDNGPLKDWNWEGQFEDTKPSAKYVNLSMYFAGSVAIRLLRRWPDDPKRVAQAREILRWMEDQFVAWERPYKDEKLSFCGYGEWDEWTVEPAVVEQYHYRQSVNSKIAKVASAFYAMYRVSGDPLDRAKARALADACVRAQEPNGRIPTILAKSGLGTQSDWMNCFYETLRTIAELSADGR